jgi:DNA-binding CsgD family transcriptional regulator
MENPIDSSLLEDNDLMSLEKFSELVASIYVGPLEMPPWKTFLEQIKVALNASFVTLILRPPSAEQSSIMVVAGPTTVDIQAQYDSKYFAFNPFVNLPHDHVQVASELLGESAWLESVLYREYLKPIDILHMMGADLQPSEKGENCQVRFNRSHTQAPFGDRDKALFALVLPHLKQSVKLFAYLDQIEIQKKLFANTIDRLQVGSVMIDKSGQILSINNLAQALLDEKDGVRLEDNLIKADYHEENVQLQKLITQALASKPSDPPGLIEAVAISRPSGKSKLTILVHVIPAGEWSDAWSPPKIAIFLRDPEQKAKSSIEVIQQLFDLTHAEALLSLHMANGMTLDEVAVKLSIRRNTARAHLRAIFSKTYVTRQSTLVRLILNSVAPLS